MIIPGTVGTDVFWTPTHPAMVEAMLDLAKLTPGDVLMDLGSGDGRIVIAAAKRGVLAIGIEDNRSLVMEARAKIVSEITCDPWPVIIEQSFYDADFSNVSVITCFLDRIPHRRLLRKFIEECRPGCRIISNTFELWEAEEEIEVETGEWFKKVRLYRVPERPRFVVVALAGKS
jgi:SAM-dependent methyltransferase